jgi:hypothetical protein
VSDVPTVEELIQYLKITEVNMGRLAGSSEDIR